MSDLSPGLSLWLAVAWMLSATLFVAGQRLRSRERAQRAEAEEWARLLQDETAQGMPLNRGTTIRAAGSPATGRPAATSAAGRSPIR